MKIYRNMKLFEIILMLYFTFGMTACANDKTIEPDKVINQNGGLVGLSLIVNQNTPPGLPSFLAAIDDVTSKGINLFGMAPEWSELETAPFTYSLQDPLVNPLTLIDPDKTKFKSYILVLKMIDSNRKTVPADLSTHSFDAPLVMSRFKSLIDKLSTLPSIDRISHILIGNEVDGYLSANPTELNAFATFYKESINYIHRKMPLVKVGTIITFNAAINHPTIFNTLIPDSDFIGYTYYPTDDTNPNWQMRPPSDVLADITLMAAKAGDKPFAFTEIGYPSSTANNSSEILQKQFVENMFDALRSYKEKGKLEFIFYHGQYDYPTDFCVQYRQAQGVASTYLCGFMNNLGLKNYVTGQPKQAWNAFVNKLEDW